MRSVSNIFYENMPLKDYCINNNYDYKKVMYKLKYLKNKPKYNNVPDNYLLCYIFQNYNSNYFSYANLVYHDQKLCKFCKDNNYELAKIRYLLKKEIIVNEDIITKCLNKYLEKKSKLDIKNCISLLSHDEVENYEEICLTLNVDLPALYHLDYNLKLNKLILYAWFYGSKKDDLYVLSKNDFKKILAKEKTDVIDLIVDYKINHHNLENIINFEKSYLLGIIKKQLSKFNMYQGYIPYNDLVSHGNYLLILILEKCAYRYPGQIINYLYICLSKGILTYILKNLYKKNVEYNDNYKSISYYKIYE